MAQPAGTIRTSLKALWTNDRAFTVVVALLALLPRLYVALAWTREPVWDGHYYHFGATRIAQGLGYSEDVLIGGVPMWKPWCHYPVGYSALLGGFYKLFGPALWVAPVVNAVVGAVTVAVVHRIASLALAQPRARVAAALCALHPGLILYTGVVMNELVSGLSLLLIALPVVMLGSRPLSGVLAGVALGLGALVRPTALLAGPLLLGLWQGNLTKVVRNTAIAAVTTLCVIAPWTWRNCRVMDDCALISTNGGWNLAIGALTETGRFRTLTAKDGCPVVTGQVQQDRCWGELGVQVIRRDPWHWLGLMPAKLAHTYNHESFAVGYLSEANPSLFGERGREAARALTTGFHHLLMVAAALGGIAWTLPRRHRLRELLPFSLAKVREVVSAKTFVQPLLLVALVAWVSHSAGHAEHPFYWLVVVTPLLFWLPLPKAPPRNRTLFFLAGLILLTTVTHAVFFGDDRYHMTISPVLCVLAAAALRRPWGHARRLSQP